MTPPRLARVLSTLVVSLGMVLGLAVPGARAADVTFGTPSATAVFGTGVTFVQPVTAGGSIVRVELLITFPTALGPIVHDVPVPASGGAVTLRAEWSETKDGHLVPNTSLVGRWRVTTAAGDPAEGPPVTIRYEDTRFAWHTLTGDLVRIHWYEGSDAFARRALAVGEKGVGQAAALLGVRETDPIDFFVYAAHAPFYDALGPGTRENVGGEAHPDIRTLFALIQPSQVDASWVDVVIPHELTHLVFDTAVRNPYHFAPLWLNEGLAVYLSEGYTPDWRAAVEDAVRQRNLLSLGTLGGMFPPPAFGFVLAYGESVSAVDFFVREYGKDRLVALIRSYVAGRTDDEAFKAAVGVDVAGFEKAWLKDLGATAPTRYGPQPAPTGPLPPGWSGAAATGAPGSSASSAPAAPASPAASPAAAGGEATPGSPSTGGGVSGGPILLLIAAAGLVVGAALGLARRRRMGRPMGSRGEADRPETLP